MKLLLDTCVFNEKTLLSHLKELDSTKIQLYINSIIFLELGYIYFVRQKWNIFTTMLKELRIKNEDITKSIAERAVRASIAFKDSEEGASYYFRDCLIGATAELQKMILITRNVEDFTWLPKDSCLTPDQILKNLK
ncbi:MAG: type II toxin-antitoxin system VapC family toxin [Candidatus Helarchaeota archaeon]|nr:type II toxin-antitoxin system VapC family toxin [Candidatus Helarchaeota archaeon]